MIVSLGSDYTASVSKMRSRLHSRRPLRAATLAGETRCAAVLGLLVVGEACALHPKPIYSKTQADAEKKMGGVYEKRFECRDETIRRYDNYATSVRATDALQILGGAVSLGGGLSAAVIEGTDSGPQSATISTAAVAALGGAVALAAKFVGKTESKTTFFLASHRAEQRGSRAIDRIEEAEATMSSLVSMRARILGAKCHPLELARVQGVATGVPPLDWISIETAAMSAKIVELRRYVRDGKRIARDFFQACRTPDAGDNLETLEDVGAPPKAAFPQAENLVAELSESFGDARECTTKKAVTPSAVPDPEEEESLAKPSVEGTGEHGAATALLLTGRPRSRD